MRFTTLCGGLLPDCFMEQFTIFLMSQVEFTGAPRIHRCPQNSDARPQHRELHAKGCETGTPAYSPYPRRLGSLTIC